MMMVPMSGSLKRRCSRASSSCRTRASGQKRSPMVMTSAMPFGAALSGPLICRVTLRFSLSMTRSSQSYPIPSVFIVLDNGVNCTPLAESGRSDIRLISRARSATRSPNREPGTISSTRRQSTARRPFTPSSTVQNTSARSRRTFLLSTMRVSPPVPGSTASRGISGNDTAALPSSIRIR